jgi:protein TonB
MRSKVGALAAVLVLATLLGCAAGGPDGAVRQFLAAATKQDRKGMYERLSLSRQQGVEGLERFRQSLEQTGNKPQWSGGELGVSQYGLFLRSISGFRVLGTETVGDDAIVTAEVTYSEKDHGPVFVRDVKLGESPEYGGGFLPSVRPIFFQAKGTGPLGPRYTTDPELQSGGTYQRRDMTLVAEAIRSVKLKLHVGHDPQTKRWWIYGIDQPYWERDDSPLELNQEALANFDLHGAGPDASQAAGKGPEEGPEVAQARAKIQAARTMYLRALAHERALDRPGYVRLLEDAARLAPSLGKEIAPLWWHEALRVFYAEPTEATSLALDQAAKLDPTLGDPALGDKDTVFAMGRMIGWRSPRMQRFEEQEEARRNKEGPPKETPVIVVPYKELTTPVVRLVGVPRVRDGVLPLLAGQCRPSLVGWTPPQDPRGSNASYATVTLEVVLGDDARVLDRVDPGTFSDGRGVPPVRLVSGPQELARAAETSVRQSKFKPLEVFGMARQSLVQIEIPFPAKAGRGSPPGSGASSSSDEELPKFGEYVYVDELPEATTRVSPVYPEAAKQARIGGTVMVQALVAKDGVVKDTRVTKSIPALDAAAVTAVRQWRFKPARTKGQATAVWVAVPVKFEP